MILTFPREAVYCTQTMAMETRTALILLTPDKDGCSEGIKFSYQKNAKNRKHNRGRTRTGGLQTEIRHVNQLSYMTYGHMLDGKHVSLSPPSSLFT